MSRLKTAFEKSRVIGPLHTGGPVTVTTDGLHIVTCVGEEAVLTRLSDGQELRRFTADSETIHSLCLTSSSSHLVIFTASQSLHIYDDPLAPASTSKPVRPSRTIGRAHEAPAHVCKFDPTSTLLASGSADGVVKVWDIRRGYATHAFKGHGGVVSALQFRYVNDTSTAINTEPTLHLITASVDTRLRIFDLSPTTARSGNNRPVAVLEGHVSVPRGLEMSHDGRWLISGGRDSVVLVWDFGGDQPTSQRKAMKGKSSSLHEPILFRTIPILERVEAVGFVSSDPAKLHFFTAGENGLIKIWDARSGNMLFHMNDDVGLSQDPEQQREVLIASYIPSSNVVFSVHADQNILFHSLSSHSLIQQLIGFNDEIISTSFLSVTGDDSHIAVAANSSLIRIYSTSENDARLLPGHSNMVLCLDHSADRRVLASGSKDKSARIWAFSSAAKNWSNIAVCEGHAESVGAIAMSRKGGDLSKDGLRYVFTGSQDRTIKMWNLSAIAPDSCTDTPVRCRSLATLKSHDKDINSLDVSPNDLYLASGSQDKTAKVYEITYTTSPSGAVKGDIKVLGTCKGHKRGVWIVKFGKTERILASGSGDKTIKLWNLNDFSCIKTFEGHTNSVLQVEFMNQDLQLASAASDGLLKLWNVRSEECIATMDNHEDKVWALASSSDESMLVTGAADSVVTFWKDSTEEKEKEKLAKREEDVLREQDFANYLQLKDYRKAISLALSMDHPGRLLSIFKSLIASGEHVSDFEHSESIVGHRSVDLVIRRLPPVELTTLLRHVRDWNTNAKTSSVAQTILYALFKLRTTDDISDTFSSSGTLMHASAAPSVTSSLSELVETLIPYTERHLARLDRLVQDSYVLDYVLGEMDGGLFSDDAMIVDL